ncbi:hypothetical protein FRC08_012473 [Ceratobasidium sp. 394]|nr:hypothetical protein FRC08_012473 [Ceratobasidium sp. 394]
MRREHSWISPEECFEMIDHITRKCPHLQTLRIFPCKFADDDANYNGIASLTYLRTLALGAIEIDQELLLALSQLPHLETLSLHTYTSQQAQAKYDPIDIPDDAFPALRHLALYGLSECSIQVICTLPPLFRHLVTASFISPERRHSKISDQRDFSFTLLQSLDRSPHLVDLTVLTPGQETCLALYSPVILDVLRHLPLRRLRLDRARLKSWGDIDELDSDDSDVDESIGHVDIQWRDFFVTVPHLEELHLDLQVISSRYLGVFASSLPNLRLLVLMGVLFEGGEISVDQAATQPITIRCPFYVDTEDQNEWANASKVAKYIHRIWPNAQFEVKKSMSWIYYDEPLDEAAGVIAGFNEALELLRSSDN